MIKFKVGDKVAVTEVAIGNEGYYSTSSKGEVICLDSAREGYQVDFGDTSTHPNKNLTRWWVSGDYLKLVDVSSPPQIGDRVVALVGNEVYYGKGDVGSVIGVDDSGMYVAFDESDTVFDVRGDREWYVESKDVAVISWEGGSTGKGEEKAPVTPLWCEDETVFKDGGILCHVWDVVDEEEADDCTIDIVTDYRPEEVYPFWVEPHDCGWKYAKPVDIDSKLLLGNKVDANTTTTTTTTKANDSTTVEAGDRIRVTSAKGQKATVTRVGEYDVLAVFDGEDKDALYISYENFEVIKEEGEV